MTNDEIGVIINDFLETNDVLRFKSVDNVNHRPHPYMVGPAHIEYASKHDGGMLGDETLKKVKCAQPGCQLLYEEHASDKVVFLSIRRDCTSEEVRDTLTDLIGKFPEKQFDGFAFVETAEKFRIDGE